MERGELRRGLRVRAEREAPARGTWPRYAGREGTVRVVDNDGEVGVELDGAHAGLYSWFLPEELVLGTTRPTRSHASREDG